MFIVISYVAIGLGFFHHMHLELYHNSYIPISFDLIIHLSTTILSVISITTKSYHFLMGHKCYPEAIVVDQSCPDAMAFYFLHHSC